MNKRTGHVAVSALMVGASLAVGTATAAADDSFSCSAVAVGNSLELTWDYEGASASYIRQDGKFRWTVPNGENFTTIANTGEVSVRVWERGSPIDAPCTDGLVDWTKTCTVAGGQTTVSWDRPAGLGADATYYLRKNGTYLGAVTGATSYTPVAPFTEADTVTVRYWDRGTLREAICTSSESTGELGQLAMPAGFSTAGHAPDRPMTTTMSDGTIYMAGTADGRSDGAFVVLASQAGSDELTEIFRSTDDSVGVSLIAANKATNTLVLQVTNPDSLETSYRVVQGNTVTDYPLADLAISFNFHASYNEAVLTDAGLLIGQGGLDTDDNRRDNHELVVFDVNTGESSLLFDGNGNAEYRPESMTADGVDLHYTAIVGKSRSAFTLNTQTGVVRPLGGSWDDLSRVASGITQGPGAEATWLERGAGSVVNLVDDSGLSVEVYNGAIFDAEVIRNAGNIFLAIQPAAIGAETQFFRYDVADGDLIDLGTHPTGWNLTRRGFVKLGFDGDDVMFVADPIPSELLGGRVFRITE